MRKMIVSGVFTLSLVFLPSLVQAGDVTFVQEGEVSNGTIIEDDAMNYFASGKHKQEMEAQIQDQEGQQVIQGNAVPASELETLPIATGINGKAKLKVKSGQLVTNTDVESENYAPCSEAGSNPDECKQQMGAEPKRAVSNASSYEQPKTLNQQLQEKHGEQDAPDAIPAAVSATETIKNSANVVNTSIVDKEQGAKINIISNTDTGVDIGE